MQALNDLVKLSHLFGGADYVKGGGGNTSFKDTNTLWVKPSGTTLKEIEANDFVLMSRGAIDKLYDFQVPAGVVERENAVKNLMQSAVFPESSGRPSVEAPLHNLLNARFVVHTHPAIVNGMTCSMNGKQKCSELFPKALWIDYTDPGYTLCMKAAKEIEAYKQGHHGQEPAVIFLENHGVFVSADEPDEIISLYENIIKCLSEHYRENDVNLNVEIKDFDLGITSQIGSQIKSILPWDNQLKIKVSGCFDYAEGPVSPDHIVYAKSFPFVGDLKDSELQRYYQKYNYYPKVFIGREWIATADKTLAKAQLVLDLAEDAAQVKQLAKAFGGIKYLSESSRLFIENWEVENYRQSVSA
jgi:rhamnose utilization protein RhaD (predicted bifunctional aldolase and dehydrogenase)